MDLFVSAAISTLSKQKKESLVFLYFIDIQLIFKFSLDQSFPFLIIYINPPPPAPRPCLPNINMYKFLSTKLTYFLF